MSTTTAQLTSSTALLTTTKRVDAASTAQHDYRRLLIAPTAGFISAGLEITATWPAEYAKTQLQLNRKNPGFKIGKHMMSTGVLGVYKGLTPMLIGAPIQGLLRFSSLDFFEKLFAGRFAAPAKDAAQNAANERKTVSASSKRLSGLCAGIMAGALESVLVVTPMETVKTRLVDSGMGLRKGVAFVVQRDGIAGLYKGVGATMGKSMSNQALRFLIFGEYKRILLGWKEGHAAPTLTPYESLFGGMFTGCTGAICNTPIDTIKTRMQGLGASRYKGVMHCAVTLVQEEGVRALWKGLTPRMARVVPGQGIIFCSYETIAGWLRERVG